VPRIRGAVNSIKKTLKSAQYDQIKTLSQPPLFQLEIFFAQILPRKLRFERDNPAPSGIATADSGNVGFDIVITLRNRKKVRT
jgi:hypothetical protein